jgi:hypothetical protein
VGRDLGFTPEIVSTELSQGVEEDRGWCIQAAGAYNTTARSRLPVIILDDSAMLASRLADYDITEPDIGIVVWDTAADTDENAEA